MCVCVCVCACVFVCVCFRRFFFIFLHDAHIFDYKVPYKKSTRLAL